MKRLLAANSGAIYQICKAFRNGEAGTQHNPEFTMLEWYRPGFNHHDLMNEMDELLQAVLQCPAAERLSYQAAFERQCNINPHKATLAELEAVAATFKLTVTAAFNKDDKDSWLDLLMSHVIEQDLGRDGPCFIYDYPASQAALAKVRQGTTPVAERFEVYIKGVELANGFHELTDSTEQATRFRQDLAKRQQLGLEAVPIDTNLLDALQHGLPDCAGVALGIDRLVMLACNTQTIRDVLSFPLERA